MWESFVEDAVKAVEEQGEIRRHWGRIKQAANRKRTNQEQREELFGALDAVGLTTYPGIDVVNPGSKDWVYIFPKEKASKRFGLRFETEQQFESAIISGLDRIRKLHDMRVVEQQYRLSTNRVIDILGRRGPNWVVIEVERGDGHRETPAQVMQYVDDLRAQTDDDGELLVREGQSIEAIVISQEYDEASGKSLKAIADANDFSARWLVAKIEFDEY